jgi:hypothetical protein
MSEILFRVPSRAVQYGYVEMPVIVEGDPSPEVVASMYVSWIYAFQKEELATIERLKGGGDVQMGDTRLASAIAESVADSRAIQEAFKDAPSGAVKAPLAASQPEVDHPVDPVDKAAQMVAEGLGGATEIPWKQEVATPKKPWETEATTPVVDTPDW